MTAPPLAEIPVALQGRGQHVFGIRSEPATPAPIGVLVLPANNNAFGGRTRFALRLSRRVAAAGLRALRFDYQGTGESGGGVETLIADNPSVDDAEAAARSLIELGHSSIVMVGYCYGARVALAVADRLPEIIGLALVSPPVEARLRPPKRTLLSLVRDALHPARWSALRYRAARGRYRRVVRRRLQYAVPWSKTRRKIEGTFRQPKLTPLFVHGIEELAERGIPTLLVYGSSDKAWGVVQRAQDERVDRIIAPGASSVELRVIPGAIHGLRDEVAEDAAIELLTTWVVEIDAEHQHRV
jgi:pimeloyl-ACP methyl ester carboxylesterase